MEGADDDDGPHRLPDGIEEAQLLEEWRNIQTDIRHFGRKRFLQLTVFVGLVGFLGREIIPFRHDPSTHLTLGALGVILSSTFYVMEKSTVEYIANWYERGKEIESEMEMELLSNYLPPRHGRHKWRRATTMTYVLYGIFGISSLALALWGVGGYL